jgi:Spy/CpxP family protein refolding chaperone
MSKSRYPHPRLRIALLATALSLPLAAIAMPPGGGPHGPGPDDPAAAQRGGRHHSPEQQTQRMKEGLGLSDEQAAAVGEINKRYAERIDALKPTPEEREQRRQQMHALMAERNEELKQVLNEEQYAKHLQHQQQMMQRFRDRKTTTEPAPG